MLQAGIPRYQHAAVLRDLGAEIEYAMLPYQASYHAMKPGSETQNHQEILRLEEPLLRSYVIRFDPSVPPERMMEQLLRSCTLVECCSPVVVQQLLERPNDARLADQRMLDSIRVFTAWDVEGGSDTVLIGISDSGVLQDHEDLKDAIHVNTAEVPANGIDDDGNGYVDDHRGYNFCTSDDGTPPGNTFNKREGHGTGVAGICGATSNNAIGVAGVTRNNKLVPIKTMPDNMGGIVYGYESLVYCAVNGIDVVNCSWGSFNRSCIDEAVVAYTIARGTAIVAAAGNHGTPTSFYPGSYPGVLNVGVTNPDDSVIAMSGHGPTVDVMAPGQETLTTSNDGGYGGFCCTSGASPIVAAVVGMVRSRHPDLTPIQACALVRESARRAPWSSDGGIIVPGTKVPGTMIPDLLPFGRIDVLNAVSMSPDSLPSMEWSSPVISARSGDERWGVGDTIDITLDGTSVLAEWTAVELAQVRVVGAQASAVSLISSATIPINEELSTGERLRIPMASCVVQRSTDTAVYIVATIRGTTGAGEIHERPIQVAVVPAPAFRTVSNDVLTVSLGDRGRIGNTDIQRGQGDGLVYRRFCGQLYEGGLMIGANGLVVDAVRAERGVHDFFHPLKPFVAPEPLTAVFTDADAPDSLRLGVRAEVQAFVASKDSGVVVLDVTVENTSDSVLRNVGVAWYLDWDLGTNPAHNFVRKGTSVAEIVAGSIVNGEPLVLMQTSSYHTDAMPITVLVDNSTTYAGFPIGRKSSMLRGEEVGVELSDADVAAATGMRFLYPLEPRSRRSYRQVLVIDTLESRLYELGSATSQVGRPQDSLFSSQNQTLGTPFPIPARSLVTIPITGPVHNGELAIHDVQGQKVWSTWVTSNAPTLVAADVSALPSGTYDVRLLNGVVVSRRSLVVLR